MSRAETRLAVLVGHPTPCSRTHTVAARAGHLVRQALAASGVPLSPPRLVDLAELAPHLLDGHGNGRAADMAAETVRQTPLLLVASPTFRGAYSGLLKLFLDLLPRHGLDGTIVVPLMTAGIPEHRTTVDTTLRPILLELRAQVPTAGISVLETELTSFDEIFDAWWAAHGPALRRALHARADGFQKEVSSC